MSADMRAESTPVWIYRHPDVTEGRGDLGLVYSVGAIGETSVKPNGSVGTFATLDHARLFADALAARRGVTVLVLPSADPARNERQA